MMPIGPSPYMQNHVPRYCPHCHTRHTWDQACLVQIPISNIPPDAEVRSEAPSGAQKGRKPETVSLIPPEALLALARVYSFGSTKYAPWNWRKGYPWSWSYDALQRHLLAFWDGEDDDPESGLPHLAHAMWHCVCLLVFSQEHLDLDDRYTSVMRGKVDGE